MDGILKDRASQDDFYICSERVTMKLLLFLEQSLVKKHTLSCMKALPQAEPSLKRETHFSFQTNFLSRLFKVSCNYYPIIYWWTLPLLNVEQVHFRDVGSFLSL